MTLDVYFTFEVIRVRCEHNNLRMARQCKSKHNIILQDPARLSQREGEGS